MWFGGHEAVLDFSTKRLWRRLDDGSRGMYFRGDCEGNAHRLAVGPGDEYQIAGGEITPATWGLRWPRTTKGEGGEDMKRYKFRREDNQEIIEVPWSVMIEQQGGFITLEDGTLAKRCAQAPGKRPPKREQLLAGGRKIVSDALGFGQHQLAEFEEDRKKNGFSGVEFVRDPSVPEFLQVHCSSRAEFNRYVKHRGMVNKGSLGGVRISVEEMERAEEMIRRLYPCQN